MANNTANNMDMDMKGDDAAMVDDILNSLRDGNHDTPSIPTEIQNQPNNQLSEQQINQQMNQQMQQQMQQQQMPTQQMPAQQIPTQQIQYQAPPVQFQQMAPEIDVEYDSNDSKINKALNMMKKPIIVIALAFILFNPITTDKLAGYLPTVFGVTNNLLRKQVRVLCLALILGLLFLGINNVL